MKEFRVAQIVPVDQLQDIDSNQYHMCLAHLVGDEGQMRKYKSFYQVQAARKDRFVLMDNGAAEGAQLPEKELLKKYEIIKPDEIVLPDTLYEPQVTLDRTTYFANRYRNLPYRFMGVPQGHNLDEWIWCMSNMVDHDRIQSIGISKFLNIATGDPMARYRAMQALQRETARIGRDDIEVHLLGCDEGPKIVGEIAMMFPMVRGCDSAFTYIATKAGNKSIKPQTKRPRNVEIEFLDDPRLEEFVQNAKDFERVAGAVDNGVSQTWHKGKEDVNCEKIR